MKLHETSNKSGRFLLLQKEDELLITRIKKGNISAAAKRLDAEDLLEEREVHNRGRV